MNDYSLTDAQIAQFHRDGYIVYPQLLDREEVSLVLETAKTDRIMMEHSYGAKDIEGRESKLALWNHPADNIYGAVARSHRIVRAMERLLGDEVYHYHSKIMLKEPYVGGAWEWHQDYGYWYQNGCLYPTMASCLIALDAATQENGCLQVIKGSHHIGRVEHGRFGEQTGADPERVAAALERMELVYCEMEPGSALFFHGNVLHRSDANTSPKPRWSLICCYNTRSNDPYKESHHPRYTPLDVLPDTAIKEVGRKGFSEDRDFLDPKNDRTTWAGKESN